MNTKCDHFKTYCNPTPLPDYPLGRLCLRGHHLPYKYDYRETADPSVIYEGGKWYLYPSCGMVYVSEDFIHWKHKKMTPYDIGYAPTVVKHKGKFLLIASESEMYSSLSPEGPFECIGALHDDTGKEYRVGDPMLFSDDDGRLYLYSGCGEEIRGCELDNDDPTRLITENMLMFGMNTKDHVWERMGEWNEDPSYSWIEGAWMYKRNGVYYLTYSAPGTEWISYGMGAYKSSSPLGPWEYMETSPFLLTKKGLIRGTGHGSIVDGPNGTTWVFYTICVCYAGAFERRIGYDPIGFDENGNIIPTSASENPCYAPGVIKNPHLDNSTNLIPLTQMKRPIASSCAEGRDEIYALDDSLLTWWQPRKDDPMPCLPIKLSGDPLTVAAVRIMWRDAGLSVKDGYLPGPFGYKVDVKVRNEEWTTVIDKSDNKTDMLIDYIPIDPVLATDIRLIITSKPENIEPGVMNFTAFGY